MHNTVVVHFDDGKILKGTSVDFSPARPSFHLQEDGSGEITEIAIAGLKAVFFVKSYAGDPVHKDDQDAERAGFGKRLQVIFRDGEKMSGYTSGYAPNRPAFFMFPADPESNNEKIFVVAAATTEVKFL
jgi:hypothetical protein